MINPNKRIQPKAGIENDKQKSKSPKLPVGKIVSNEPLAIYVTEGPLEGWHNFNKYDEIVEFCEKLMKADWEFVFDPNW